MPPRYVEHGHLDCTAGWWLAMVRCLLVSKCLESRHAVGTSNVTQHFHEVTETWVILQQCICWLLQQYGSIHAYRQHHQKDHPWIQLIEIKPNSLYKQTSYGTLVQNPGNIKNMMGQNNQQVSVMLARSLPTRWCTGSFRTVCMVYVPMFHSSWY